MMVRWIVGLSLMFAALWSGSLYEGEYLPQSGVAQAPVETGIPNAVDGNRLLHWHGYVTHFPPIGFQGTHPTSEGRAALKRLKELLSQNRNRISYVAVIGHSSSVVDEENRIDEGGWFGFWHSFGEGTMTKEKAVSLVNQRIRAVYDLVKESGLSSAQIYNENRLDKDPLFTEATAEGRAGNNRVEVMLFSNGPLYLSDLHIQFAFDSARILPGYDSRIEHFAELMRRNPSMSVTLVGHTDRRGSYAYNMELSRRRAASVKNRLVSLGISPSRIKTRGEGYTQPIAQGNDEESHHRNRRVEAQLYRY